MTDLRLLACADFVKGRIICDIGTDHGYLPTFLLQNAKCDFAYACDVNEKPLAVASETITSAGLSNKAKTILSDGLKSVKIAEWGISDVVIAGMGGELISDILSHANFDEISNVNFILQPMTAHTFLRKFLYANGFEITAEKIVPEKKFEYVILNAKYTGVKREISELESYLGRLDLSDKNAVAHIKKIAEKNFKIAFARQDINIFITSYQMLKKIGENKMITVKNAYDIMDKIAPWSITQKGDNSGHIVGCLDAEVTKILICLDITKDVVLEALEVGANLIISHHPVIYNPLYKLSDNSPAAFAYKNGISLICSHSPLDMADGGINDLIYDLLKDEFKLKYKDEVLEVIYPCGRGYGMICSANCSHNSTEMAEFLKKTFNCKVVRYTNTTKPIRKIAFCSGGSGGLVETALEMGADAYIGGDFKHDAFITATNNDFAIFDCGHFHTEVICAEYLLKKFNEYLPEVEISIAKNSVDPASYAI